LAEAAFLGGFGAPHAASKRPSEKPAAVETARPTTHDKHVRAKWYTRSLGTPEGAAASIIPSYRVAAIRLQDCLEEPRGVKSAAVRVLVDRLRERIRSRGWPSI